MFQFFEILRYTLFVQLIFLIRFNKAIPDELSTTIVDENGVEIELKWLKTNQFLANEHLPIWRAYPYGNIVRDDQVMKSLGNFQMYHDLKESSAVIYLEQDDSLYGVIGTKYLLVGFPVEKLQEKHTVGQTDYLIGVAPINNNEASISEMDSRNLPLKKRPYQDNEASTSCDDANSLYEKRPRFNEEHNSPGMSENYLDKPSTSKMHSTSELYKNIDENSEYKPLGPFYPEILVLVSHDAMKTLNHKFPPGDNLKEHIMHNLILLNGVSMLFAKLARDVEININIAGIIFEEVPGAFPFSTSHYINGQLICPNQQLVSDSISNYINEAKSIYEEKFNEDSFDFFMFLTEFKHVTNENEEIPRGISTKFFNIYSQRISAKLTCQLTINEFKAKYKISKFLGSIIHNTAIFQTYIDTTREIAHLMKISDDDVKSQTIMEKEACNLYVNCLKWSPKSIEDFRTYFSKNINRCFLLNKPRSLHKYNVPRKTLSDIDQCHCYGIKTPIEIKDHLVSANKRSRKCRTRLACYSSPYENSRKGFAIQNVPYPVDGTPCGTEKVCWNKQCVRGIMNV